MKQVYEKPSANEVQLLTEELMGIIKASANYTITPSPMLSNWFGVDVDVDAEASAEDW